MKKFWPLLILLISSLFIISCDNSDDNDSNNNNVNVDYPAVFDLPPINLQQNGKYDYATKNDFSGMLNQDFILVYRKNQENNVPFWEPLPLKIFINNISNNEINYSFNFITNNVEIHLSLSPNFNFDLLTANFESTYIKNQTFRVVLVPAVYGNKNANAADLHKMSYEDVIKKYNINDSNVTTLK
ncbi:MAG TPA: hypothetical protein DD740_07605 [Chryseobacterium sp.]|nr:hypothetical protein [Chryseobacterium sp.]